MSYTEEKTAAFKKFANQKFINHFKDYMNYSYSIEDSDAEIALQSAMCRYYNDKIQQKFNFNQIKKQYEYNVTHINPNLDSIQKNKVLNREQDKLESFARLKYLDEDINKSCYELFQLMFIYAIFCKLNKKSLNDIAKSSVGQYLLYACMEYHANFPKILELPLSELTKRLYNSIALFDNYLGDVDFLLERGDAIPVVRVDIAYKDEYALELTPEELEDFEELNEDQQVIFITNKRFKERLILEMHTLENGMTF